jgi:hypothetical protein
LTAVGTSASKDAPKKLSATMNQLHSRKAVMRHHLLALAVLLAVVATSFSSMPLRETPLVFTCSDESGGGSAVFFSMIPEQRDKDKNVLKPAFGVAYRVDGEGKFTELYRTTNWYSRYVYVSIDGRHLVQLEPASVGERPSKEDLAVAFHRDGKLVKSYSTVDLIKDPKKVVVTWSSYLWLAPSIRAEVTAGQSLQLQPKLTYDDKFTLHTIDGWTYVFDVTTGAIVSTNKTKL